MKALKGLLVLLRTKFGIDSKFLISIFGFVVLVAVVGAIINLTNMNKNTASIISMALAAVLIGIVFRR